MSTTYSLTRRAQSQKFKVQFENIQYYTQSSKSNRQFNLNKERYFIFIKYLKAKSFWLEEFNLGIFDIISSHKS